MTPHHLETLWASGQTRIPPSAASTRNPKITSGTPCSSLRSAMAVGPRMALTTRATHRIACS
eukprot:6964037-Alexandrium_andersonii.AAC.1